MAASVLLAILALCVYIGAVVVVGAGAALRAGPPLRSSGGAEARRPPGRLGLPLLLCGVALQIASIGALCVGTRRSPFAGEYGDLCVLALAVVVAAVALDARGRLAALRAIAGAAAALILFGALANAGRHLAGTTTITGWLVSLHVLAILGGFGLMAVACACAALYVVQDRLLRSHRVGGLFQTLPPLGAVDSVAFHAVAYGWPLITLGLALGAARAVQGGLRQPLAAWLVDTHTLVAVVLWAIYAFYLSARIGAGWRGVRLHYVLVVGILALTAIYMAPTTTHHFR